MNTIRIFGWVLVGIILLMTASCSEDENAGTAMLEVRLTDAPGDYEAVMVDIQDVQVKASKDNSEDGWISLDVNTGKYDLLKLTNGLDTLLGTAELPAGKISQIRLVLGEENTVTVDGVEVALFTPSAQQSGLKVLVTAELQAGLTSVITLDFDAARSIVATGVGSYNLKPVIRALVETTDGAIDGQVNPADGSSHVYAIMGTDTVSTSISEGGRFLVGGLEGGTYRVVLVPTEGFMELEVEDVEVTVGQITHLGTLTMVVE
jgi:hypothetical protein